jgi:hydroxymethylbilane synthase
VRVQTEGDVNAAAIAQIGGTGVFVTALRDALLAGTVDLAVHSYKDLPTAPAEGLVVAAVPPREDPRDVLVARDGLTLGELAAGARIGTGSPRRTAQLLGLGLGLDVVPIRGNVDTRIGKVRSGELDAVVLARAGLARLGRLDEATEVIDPLTMLPAPGPGRARDRVPRRRPRAGGAARRARRRGHPHRRRRRARPARRPRGGLHRAGRGTRPGRGRRRRARDLPPRPRGRVDGSDAVRLSATGPTSEAAEVGRRLAAELLDLGASHLMGART